MKKNSFLDGAIIATVCIIICKILGLLYVIPFYKIIGTQGGALYSYAYSIYAMFLNLSTIGVPTAIAKIISEYDTLGYHYLKQRSFKIASKLLNYFGIISFVIMFLFSDFIANAIIGGVEGGNTVGDVSTAIKVVSTALLVVPRLSILKGYFQGHKYISKTSWANILEQLIRVTVIIVGSYVVVDFFNLPIKYAVYIAVFGATIGAFLAYIYLKVKVKDQIIKDFSVTTIAEEEKNISSKFLLKKIVFYAIPFVIISMAQSAYNGVDTFTILRTLNSIGFSAADAELVIGVMTTWGSKLNMIVVAISTGLVASLIPNIVESYTKKDFKDINKKINLSIKMLLCVTVPMTLGISFLAEPIWYVFYGHDVFSSSIFSVRIIHVISFGLMTTLINCTQAMNKTKLTIGALATSFLIKLVLNVPMMYLLDCLNLPAYHAPTVTDLISHLTVFIAVLLILKKEFKFNYSEIFPYTLKTIVSVSVMLIGLLILKQVYFNVETVFSSIITIIVYTIFGAGIYFAASHFLGMLAEIFGKDYIVKFLKKVKIIKK